MHATKLESDFRALYPEHSEPLLLSFAIKDTQLVVRPDILCTQHNNAIGRNHLSKVNVSPLCYTCGKALLQQDQTEYNKQMTLVK